MSGFAARDLSLTMTVVLRPMPEDFDGPTTLTVCVAVVREVAARRAAVEVATITCLGLCQNGPNIRLAPGNS